jgi:hypothetical protein
MSRVNKNTTKKQENDVMSKKWEESEDEVEVLKDDDDKEEVDEQEHDEVKKPSITDFDRSEVVGLEERKVKDLNSIELLKVLVHRGESSFNPALKTGAMNVMKMLNGESLRRPFNNDNRGGRGRARPFDRFHQGGRVERFSRFRNERESRFDNTNKRFENNDDRRDDRRHKHHYDEKDAQSKREVRYYKDAEDTT